jgi:hypothetical protein
VVLVFQPAEEGYGGAKKMIEDGAVENIDAIFGLHVANVVPIGVLASRPGPIMAGSGFFEAIISGKGGHAALPHHTIDPILAASNVIVSLQQLVSREADPLDSQVLFHPLSNYYFVAACFIFPHECIFFRPPYLVPFGGNLLLYGFLLFNYRRRDQ